MLTNFKVKTEQWSYLVLCAFIACFRNFDFLLDPVPYAEEGTYFVSKAYEIGFQSIFQTYSGYLQLPQTFLVTLGMKLMGLEYLPVFLAWSSIFVNLIPCFILFFGKSSIPTTLPAKALLAFLTLLGSPEANTYSVVHFNFIFGWIACLLLFEELNPNTGFRMFSLFLLVLAPMSGPMSIFLLPMFLWKAFSEKSRFALSQLLWLMVGSLVAVGFFIGNYLHSPQSQEFTNRFSDGDLGYFLFQYVMSFLVGNSWGYYEECNRLMAIMALSIGIGIVLKYGRLKEVKLLAVSILLMSLPSFLLSLGMKGGYRYVYSANLLFFWLLLFITQEKFSHLRMFILSIFIAAAVSYSPKFMAFKRPKRILWKDEIQKWKNDALYSPSIYPFNDWDTTKPWKIELKKD